MDQIWTKYLLVCDLANQSIQWTRRWHFDVCLFSQVLQKHYLDEVETVASFDPLQQIYVPSLYYSRNVEDVRFLEPHILQDFIAYSTYQLTLTVWRFITAVWTFHSAIAVDIISQTQSHCTSESVPRTSCIQTLCINVSERWGLIDGFNVCSYYHVDLSTLI